MKYYSVYMVSLETSQIKRITEHFFHQFGLFKFFQDTRYSMDGFFILDLKFHYIGDVKIKYPNLPFNLIGDMHDFGSRPCFYRFRFKQLYLPESFFV